MNAALRLGLTALFDLPGEVGGADNYLLEPNSDLGRWAAAPGVVLVALAAIPRGGKIVGTLADVDTEPKFSISSAGPMLRVPPKFLELHSGVKPEEPIDAHSVQPYYTLLLAREAGMTISIRATAEEIVLAAA